MQIFKLISGEFEYGISTISREFFEQRLRLPVNRSEVQGRDVIVEITGKVSHPDEIERIMETWPKYYQENRARYDFANHKLYPVGAKLAEYLGPNNDKRYGLPEEVEQLVSKKDSEYKRYQTVAGDLDAVLSEYERAALQKQSFEDEKEVT